MNGLISTRNKSLVKTIFVLRHIKIDVIYIYALVGEFLRIARATLYLSDFEPKAIDLVNRMLNQGGDVHPLKNIFSKSSDVILIPSLSSLSDQKISSKNTSLLQSHNS